MSKSRDTDAVADKSKEKIIEINEPHRRLEDRFEELNNKFQSELANKSKTEAFEAIHSIQDKALKWADSQLKILKFAMSVVLTVITVLGIGGYFKYSELTGKLDTGYDNFEIKITEASRRIDTNIAATQKSLDETIMELKKQVEEARQLIKNLEAEETNEKIAEVKNSIKDLTALKNSMKSISRSVIKLTLHYKKKNSEDSEKFLEAISEDLFSRGFVLSPEQVLGLDSNNSEIIYYSPTTAPAAREIKEVFQKQGYPDIESNMESSDIHDAPNRIIIKLKPSKQKKLNRR